MSDVEKKQSATEHREFLDRLDAAISDEVLEKAYMYARKRVHLLDRFGVPIESKTHEHLVASALSDTALGDVRWDHDKSDLFNHLCSVVRFRTKDMIAHARACAGPMRCSELRPRAKRM